MKECRFFKISGKVQGVWFRESTRQQAERLGISGHAINCPDGTVEVVACGDALAMQALRDWLKSGPATARVSSVHERRHEGDCPEGFRTG